MKAKLFKSACSVILVAVIFVTSCIPVYADEVWTTLNGYQYTYEWHLQLSLNYTYNYASAITRLRSATGTMIPPYYMRAKSILFEQYSISKATKDLYNTVATSSLRAEAYTHDSGTYSAYGYVEVLASSGGAINSDYGQTFYVPFNPGSKGVPYREYSIDNFYGEYGTTSDGKTYGSALNADRYGYYPDLISAKGDNGAIGYVEYDDLFFTPESKEDIINYMSNMNYDPIPVYDLSGNVIDWFYFSDDSIKYE